MPLGTALPVHPRSPPPRPKRTRVPGDHRMPGHPPTRLMCRACPFRFIVVNAACYWFQCSAGASPQHAHNDLARFHLPCSHLHILRLCTATAPRALVPHLMPCLALNVLAARCWQSMDPCAKGLCEDWILSAFSSSKFNGDGATPRPAPPAPLHYPHAQR